MELFLMFLLAIFIWISFSFVSYGLMFAHFDEKYGCTFEDFFYVFTISLFFGPFAALGGFIYLCFENGFMRAFKRGFRFSCYGKEEETGSMLTPHQLTSNVCPIEYLQIILCILFVLVAIRLTLNV